MKQQTKEALKAIKRNWLPFTIMGIVITIVCLNFTKCILFAINYDIEHVKYLDNELWDEYVACHGLMMFLDITWGICITKWAINKALKKELKLKEQQKEQNKQW